MTADHTTVQRVEKPASKGRTSSRRLDEPAGLLALAAVMVGIMSLALLFVPQPPADEPPEVPPPPGEGSPEAGFARDMINHHGQAVRMAETVRDRTEDPAIRLLATETARTQQAEIGQMQGWLEAWGLPITGTGTAMAWMGHPVETGKMPGMAAPEDLARLQQATPGEADEQFLRLMIPHHQAAAEMAKSVQELSDRPEVVRFAQKTVFSQEMEIRQMQALLQRKGLSPVEGEVSMPMNAEEDSSEETPESAGEERSGQEGFASSTPAALRDTARLAPLPLAVLAAAWLGLDRIRRRRERAGLTKHIASLPVWRAIAVVGLFTSAVLHTGLTPTHFEEVTAHGIFFSVAGVAAAIAAAAVLAWPSRPAYLFGTGAALASIVLWAVFQFIPPPGAGAVESTDLVVGLLTRAAELVAAVTCAALWFRARHVYRPE